MKDLIGRLEQTAGPDRELDAFIWCADRGVELARFDGIKVWYDEGKWKGRTITVATMLPLYTASIDTALTLVPEGFAWGLRENRDCSGVAAHALAQVSRVVWGEKNEEHFYSSFDSSHPTSAIALCIAALKARAT